MKHILVFLLFSGICLAQGVRFGDSVPTQSTTTVPGVSSNVVIAVPGATVNFCSAPANAVPCTNKATTFTDSTLTIPCASSTQIVLAGTNSCVATTDTRGNWGVWVTSGAYEYTVTVNGVSSGPFPATPGGAGAGGVNCTLGSVAIPWFNATTTLCDANLTDDGAGTFGVKTLNAATAINSPLISLNGNAGFLIGPFQKQTAPASPATGQMVCWGDSGSNFFACKNSDGSNAMPTGGGGSLTVQTAGGSNSSQSTLNFIASSAVNGLTITPTNPGGGGNETFTLSGTLTNAGLTNSATTVNGQTCTLGSTCTVSGSAPTSDVGSSDTLSAAGTFATQRSITVGSAAFLEIRAHGVYSAGVGAPSMNMQVNAGGTTGLCTSGGAGSAMSGLASASNMGWDVVCYVQVVTTGAPGTVYAWGSQDLATSAGGSLTTHLLCNANPCTGATSSFTTTTAQTVSIQETATFISGQSMTLTSLIVRSY